MTSGTSRPTRILLVTHYFPAHRGGLEKVAGELAQRLAGTGTFSITWFASNCDETPVTPGVRCVAVRCWNGFERRFGVPLPLWSPFILRRLWRACGDTDAVHIHDTLYPGNIVAALIAWLRGRPLVVTQHVGPVAYRNPLLRGLVSAGNRIVAASILKRARHTFFISAAVKKYFEARVRFRTAPGLVPNGVDVELYRAPGAAERAAARAALGIAGEGPVLLFVGRFVEKKGIALLGDIARDLADTQFWFAGHGPIDPERWALKNVRVFRDRSHASLRELLWASDLLLLPSAPGSEGFPLVVQEALACGLPALVSADIADGYPAARSHLLLEPAGDGAAVRWAARVRAFIADPRPCMPAATLAEFAAEHWSWRRALDAYRDAFAECRESRALRYGAGP